MALSKFTRARLKSGFASNAAGKEIADVVDAGSGTLSAGAKHVIYANMANRNAATKFITQVNAGSNTDGYTQRHLTDVIGVTAAREVAAALNA